MVRGGHFVNIVGQACCFDKMTSHFPIFLEQVTIVLQIIELGGKWVTAPQVSATGCAAIWKAAVSKKSVSEWRGSIVLSSFFVIIVLV